MQPVYQAENLFDAHLVRGRLASEGVEATVRGEFLAGAMGELPMAGLLAVCVAEADVVQALTLLAGWQEQDGSSTVDESSVEDAQDDDLDADGFRA